eukprot:534090-Hanusia_phi.AAC.2
MLPPTVLSQARDGARIGQCPNPAIRVIIIRRTTRPRPSPQCTAPGGGVTVTSRRHIKNQPRVPGSVNREL